MAKGAIDSLVEGVKSTSQLIGDATSSVAKGILQPPTITNKITPDSVMSLINPFSKIMGGGDYIPQAWPARENPVSNTAFKALTIGTAAALIAAAIRASKRAAESDQEVYKANEIEKALKPAEPLISEDIVNKVQKRALLEPGDLMSSAVPVAALGLGAYTGYKLMDKGLEDYQNVQLSAEQQQKLDLAKQLVYARMMNARGQLSEEKYNELMGIPKTASEEAKVPPPATAPATERIGFMARTEAILGLAALMSFAGGAYLGHQYFSKSDPDRINAATRAGALNSFIRAREAGSAPRTEIFSGGAIKAMQDGSAPAAAKPDFFEKPTEEVIVP